MSTILAPCGHPGEVVIGTYVRCLQGCEGKPRAQRRGEPGHVEMCACGCCQIRRAATHIFVRNDKGQDVVKVPWDGMAKSIKFDMPPGPKQLLRHWRLIDKDGADVVSMGNLDITAYQNDGLEFDVLVKPPGISMLALRNHKIGARRGMTAKAVPFHVFDPSYLPLQRQFGEDDASFRGRIKAHMLGGRGTRSDIEAAIGCVEGLERFELKEGGRGEMFVRVLEVNYEGPRAHVISRLRAMLHDHAPASVHFQIEDVTPEALLEMACLDFQNHYLRMSDTVAGLPKVNLARLTGLQAMARVCSRWHREEFLDKDEVYVSGHDVVFSIQNERRRWNMAVMIH